MTRRKPLSKRLTTLSLARNLTSKQEHQVIAMADRARHLEADRSDLIERSDLARKIVEEHRYESPYAARRECVCGICKIGAALEGTSEFEERSEEHTSELQSLMRISYAVFCLKKQKKKNNIQSQFNQSTTTT